MRDLDRGMRREDGPTAHDSAEARPRARTSLNWALVPLGVEVEIAVQSMQFIGEEERNGEANAQPGLCRKRQAELS